MEEELYKEQTSAVFISGFGDTPESHNLLKCEFDKPPVLVCSNAEEQADVPVLQASGIDTDMPADTAETGPITAYRRMSGEFVEDIIEKARMHLESLYVASSPWDHFQNHDERLNQLSKEVHKMYERISEAVVRSAVCDAKEELVRETRGGFAGGDVQMVEGHIHPGCAEVNTADGSSDRISYQTDEMKEIQVQLYNLSREYNQLLESMAQEIVAKVVVDAQCQIVMSYI